MVRMKVSVVVSLSPRRPQVGLMWTWHVHSPGDAVMKNVFVFLLGCGFMFAYLARAPPPGRSLFSAGGASGPRIEPRRTRFLHAHRGADAPCFSRAPGARPPQMGRLILGHLTGERQGLVSGLWAALFPLYLGAANSLAGAQRRLCRGAPPALRRFSHPQQLSPRRVVRPGTDPERCAQKQTREPLRSFPAPGPCLLRLPIPAASRLGAPLLPEAATLGLNLLLSAYLYLSLARGVSREICGLLGIRVFRIVQKKD